MADEDSGDRRKLALIIVATIIVIALVGLGIRNLLGGGHGGVRKPPKVSLIPTTPPPPPPPPKEEKKPEPPKEQKEVKMDQVEKKEQPPDNPELKMEGKAGDGPSAFASGKVTSEDLSRLGAGSGGLLNPFNTYATSIRTEIQRYLGRRSDLKRRQYRVEVQLWVADDGHLKRYELLGTTNDSDTDDAIRGALAKLPAFSQPPPPNMPQPIRLRIIAGGQA
jgi:protein TonB